MQLYGNEQQPKKPGRKKAPLPEIAIINTIKATIAKDKANTQAYEDVFAICRNIEKKDHKVSHEENGKLRSIIAERLEDPEETNTATLTALFDLYKRTLLYDAWDSFDAYMLYLEIDRPPEERFYQPRRKVLKPLCSALQDLHDGKLDELFLSMPPRTGKTTMLMMFTTWLIGKNSERSNLYSAFSDIITRAFYNGVLEVINDKYTYHWQDVFPNSRVAATNAQDETIDLDRKKRYPSLTSRSLYGTLNGACDCNGMLIADDLIGGIEEALSKDRLNSAWSKVDNNLLARAKGNAKILWCGTRWSLIDPAGRRMSLLQNDPAFASRKFRIINLPALDEHDNSNFDYDYRVGFSSEFFRQRRASFEHNNDLASWFAQYQQEPIEREGAMFSPDEMRTYNGVLPDGVPDRVFMAIDPAFGGGDFTAGPVCFQFGNDVYVHDVIYSSDNKKVTQPLIVQKIKKYDVRAVFIEATKATEPYVAGIDTMLRAEHIRINLTSKPAPNTVSKETRIFDKAPDIRERFIFRESGKRTKEYEAFMQNVFSFKFLGKNKHDDAPDSLAMAADMADVATKSYSVFKRPF